MLRLRQIALVAHDLEQVVATIADALAVDVAFRDPGVAGFGLHNAVIPIGDQFLEVVSPTVPDTAAGRYLHRRHGDGGYMVILQCDGHEARRARLADMGVRFALAHDTDEYKLLQLHPADTGGSFLEIDQQTGGEDLAGPWEPAGPNWQAARRVGVVAGIRSATIQSDDPSGLAHRWSDLLEVFLDEAAEGPSLMLDNATVRFTTPSDDRGEGLAGIDLQAAEGVAPADLGVIGGVRVRLVE